MYVNLGSKRGQSVQQFLRSTPDAHRYSVHAFEPNPAHLPALRAFALRSPAAARITVHPQAAWTTATQVCPCDAENPYSRVFIGSASMFISV